MDPPPVGMDLPALLPARGVGATFLQTIPGRAPDHTSLHSEDGPTIGRLLQACLRRPLLESKGVNRLVKGLCQCAQLPLISRDPA